MDRLPVDTRQRQPKRSLSQDLTKKLISTVASIFLITTLCTYGLFTYQSRTSYNQKATEYLDYLRDSLEVPLWNIDNDWIKSICDSFAKNETVALLKIKGEDGATLYETGNDEKEGLISRTSIVRYNGQSIGSVEIGLTTRIYKKSNYQIIGGSILTMMLVVTGLAFSTKLILNRILNKPLNHLMHRIDQISSGEYRERSERFNHMEVAIILEKFNQMANEVKSREDSLIETNRMLESEISDRKEAEKALRRSEHRYRQLIEDLPVGLFRSSPEAQGPFLMVNPAFIKMFGYASKDQIADQSVKEFYQDPDMRRHVLDMLYSEDSIQGIEMEFKKRDGSTLVGLITAHMIKDTEGAPTHIDGIIEDITTRKQLERQIRQQQKMEAIGTLAGGIAHDFNNILSSMFGFAEAAKLKNASGEKIDTYINEILSGGLRARSLIRQIMAFSRQTEGQKTATAIAPILKETIKFLRASLPAMIEIKQTIISSEAMVWADPSQVHQIIMNLCTNAAHAMHAKGGLLDIKLDDIQLENEADILYGQLKSGTYARLTVCDEGEGIRKDHLERIFEPFFTTKERGEGTGMGLAVVHGIVEAMGGAISVESEVTRGAAFHVLLPMFEGESGYLEDQYRMPERGKGTILLVDDEQGFLAAGKEILEQLGYDIIPAGSGAEALDVFAPRRDRIDLVITDLVMPKMTGLELAQRLRLIKPDIVIILCTGFSDNAMPINKEALGIFDIVMKPLLAGELTRTIEKALALERTS